MSERQPYHEEAEEVMLNRASNRVTTLEASIRVDDGRKLTDRELRIFKERVWDINDYLYMIAMENEAVADLYYYHYELVDNTPHVWQEKDLDE